jgi:hypothetical protein
MLKIKGLAYSLLLVTQNYLREPAADYYDAVQLEGMEMDGERSERKKGDERGSPPSSSSFFDALRANVEPLSSVLFGGSRVFPTPNSEAAKKLRKRPVVDGSTAAGGQPLVVDDFTGTATDVRNPLNGSKTKPEQQRQQHTPKSEAAVVDGQTGLGQEEEDNEMSNQKTNVTQKDNNAIPPNLPPIANRFMPRP